MLAGQLELGQYEQVIAGGEALLELLNKTNWDDSEVQCLCQMASAYLRMGKDEKTESVIAQLKKIAGRCRQSQSYRQSSMEEIAPIEQRWMLCAKEG
jgi:predicted ATPase